MVSAYAQTIDDPLIGEALAMQGVEETRHANLLGEMLQRYGIAVAPNPLQPLPATERNFLDFGYEECIDSFFGFGIFGLAKQIQLFVPELTDIFEVVLLEEARHVTFFVNWIAFERIRRGRGFLPFQALATTLGYARAVRRIVTTFAPPGTTEAQTASLKTQGVGFGAEGAFAMFDGVTWRTFLESCVRGQDYYMSAMPPQLTRPSFLPNAARIALAVVPALGRRPASRLRAATGSRPSALQAQLDPNPREAATRAAPPTLAKEPVSA